MYKRQLLYTMILAASSFNLCEVTAGRIVPDSMEGVEASVRAVSYTHLSGRRICPGYGINFTVWEAGVRRGPDWGLR